MPSPWAESLPGSTVEGMRGRGEVVFEIVDPRSDNALWAMSEYFVELGDRFPEGFDPGDALVADAPSLREPRGCFVVMRAGETPAGCGGLSTIEEGLGEIKRMWVGPAWRGQGWGKRLLSELEDRARALGHRRVRLDTNSALTEAIAMYETAGYRAIERYNDNPYARHWFEKVVD